MYRTKKERFPGGATLTAEFAAVATPEQLALHDATLAAGGTWATTAGDPDARWGTWSLFDGRTDVLFFYRADGLVEVA